jgi:hypothetical protein
VAPALGNERGGFQFGGQLRWVLRLRSGFRQRAPASLTPACASTYRSDITCGPQVRKDPRAFNFLFQPFTTTKPDLRSVLSSVVDVQDFDALFLDAVDSNVGQAMRNQFVGSWLTSWASTLWECF